MCVQATKLRINIRCLFGLSGSPTLKQTRFCHGNCMGSGRLPEIISCENSLLFNPQIQVKVLSCIEEAICEYSPETLPSSLGQSAFKMD